MKVNYNYVVNLDWLCLHMEVTKPLDELENKKIYFSEIRTKENLVFEIKMDNYGTKVYEKKAKVWFQRNKRLYCVCTLLWCPRSSVIKSSSCQLLFNNGELYTPFVFEDLAIIQEITQLHYKSISRVDICYDCNRYKNGLLPLTLLKKYIKGTYLKIGNNSPTIYYKSFGYTIRKTPREDKSTNTKKYKQVDFGDKVINAVSWGTHASGIQVQVYNKSLELKNHYKEWIYNSWLLNKLDPTNVWRTEIRITNTALNVIRLEDESKSKLSIIDLIDNNSLKEVFLSYAQKYCRFVVHDYHAKKQHMKPIPLFCIDKNIKLTLKPKFYQYNSTGQRTIKTLSNIIDILSYYVKHGVFLPENPLITPENLETIKNEIVKNFSYNGEMEPKSIEKLEIQYEALIKNFENKNTYKELADLFNNKYFLLKNDYGL